MRATGVLLVVAASLSGCGDPAADRAREEPGVLEAAFRHALTDHPNPICDLYFLSFKRERQGEWSDAPEEVLRRLVDLEMTHGEGEERRTWTPTLKKGSEAGMPEFDWVYDPATGQKGAMCRVEILKWISPSEVTVKVHIHGAPLAGSAYTAEVKKSGNTWAVDPKSARGHIIW